METENKLENRLNEFPRINESEFKKLLPSLVSREIDIVERRKWLDVCIDPRLSVYVVDDKTGEILHRVPPLTYTTNVLTGKNVSGMVDEWSKRNDVSPFHGNIFAEENITSDLVMGTPPEEDINLWVEILERYGVVNAKVVDDTKVDTGEFKDDPNSW